MAAEISPLCTTALQIESHRRRVDALSADATGSTARNRHLTRASGVGFFIMGGTTCLNLAGRGFALKDGYSNPKLAELYDALNPWGPSDNFYLGLVMQAESVLDVGCGTGLILRQARENGHRGRLVGLDPAEPMLNVGRRQRSDIEWIYGDLSTVSFDREFELAFMASHTFQVFVDDEHIRQTLTSIHAALFEGGRLAFETRYPKARTWEEWTPEHAGEVDIPGLGIVWFQHDVQLPIHGGVVTFTSQCAAPTFEGIEESESTLRFLDIEALNEFLHEAGFQVEAQYGYWDHSPLTDESPEIITIARK